MKTLCICVGLVNAKTTNLQQTISISWYMHQLVINSAYSSSGVAAGDCPSIYGPELVNLQPGQMSAGCRTMK